MPSRKKGKIIDKLLEGAKGVKKGREVEYDDRFTKDTTVKFRGQEPLPPREDRADKIERLKASMGQGAVRMVGEGREVELELGEEEEPEPEEPPERMATDLLSIDEIIDLETIVNFHQMEVEWLIRASKAKADPQYKEIAISLSKKTQRIIQLVLKDMTIPMAIKILLVLYVAQQVSLVALIMSNAPEKPKPAKDRNPDETKKAGR